MASGSVSCLLAANKRGLLPSPSSLGDAEMPPQKKKKKKKKQRRLHMMGYLGDPEEQQSPEVSFGELATPGTSPQLKEEVQEEEQAVAEGGRGPRLSGAAKELPEWETQAISSLEASSQESLFSAEAEELSQGTKKRRKKKKHKEAVAENKDSLLDLSSVSQQAEEESQGHTELQQEGNGETGLEGLVQHKHKKKKKHREEAEEKGEAMTQTDLTSLKEEAGGDPWEGNGLGNVVEGSLGLTEGGPGGELPDHKSKRKKKKREKVGVEDEGQPLGQEAGSLWSEPIAVKQEQKGWVEVDAASGQGAEGNGSFELGLEVSTHKHKKKKKKKEQES
ncbi:hypothetical protein JRQ81_011922 [Phrynocephalus forsythii]|uniref:Uncharacterized protein n=1 Tax=Phrynocephalus forsythii TaxID=171643 RepID=A0A9Q0X729_9SAUR|nr:hypothetical protein JRQ81_011922 [Phrynocephalus forsythii]